MTQLLLIRHAQNDWVGDRLAGWTPGVHLNDAGRAEAEALANRLDGYPIDAVYASPLERTRETAAYLAEPRGIEVEIRDGVGEVRFGEWTGQSLETLREDKRWMGVQLFPSLTRFPGGETPAEAQARAVSALEALRAAHPDGVVAVVSHSDIIKLVVAYYVGLSLDLFQRLALGTASVSVLRFTKGGPRLLLFNGRDAIPPPPEPEADGSSDDGSDADADDGAVDRQAG